MTTETTTLTENCLDKFLNCLANFQYDKAKTYINGLNYFLNGEKSYTNLLFLGHKSASKQDRNFEPAWNQLDQAIRECNLHPDHASTMLNPPGVCYADVVDSCHLLICFTEFRFQMISLYVDLKDRNITGVPGSIFTSINCHIDSILKSLSKIEEKFCQKFMSNKHLFSLYTLEIQLLKYVLECHLAIDHKLDCIKALTTLKDIGDLFDTRLPNGSNSKQSKESKSFSLFLRGSSQQRTLPVLYQWFKIYHSALFGKFSLIMHDSLNRVIQRDHLMTDKVDIFSKLTSHVKKAGGFCCAGLILESSRLALVNFRGNGYEMPTSLSIEDESSQSSSFSALFFYPRIEEPLQEKLIKTLSSQVTPDLDYKVKSFFDQTQKLTYYHSKVSENLVFFLINESKTKVIQFAQEISDDLNLSNVLNVFNANLR